MATDKQALPMRRFGSFLPGDGVGGMGTHWNAMTYRFLPSDHSLRSHLTQRYGKKSVPDDMLIADWGVTYDELEATTTGSRSCAGCRARPATSRARSIPAATRSRAGAAPSTRTSR